MAIIERIVTVYNDAGSKKALKDLKNLENNFSKAGKRIAIAFGAAAGAAGTLALKLGKDAVQAAIADQKSQALLANALRNTVSASESAIAGVESYISAQQRLVSVSDDELRPSLSTLLIATKDLTQAQYLQNLALDISAGTTKDLQTVSIALARAVGGNIGALSKLGITLDGDIKKSKDVNAALKQLADTFKGAASKRAETFEYRMKGIQIAFSETLETLGYALLPVLENFAKIVQTQIIPALETFIAQNKEKLAKSLADVLKFAIGAAEALGSMAKTVSDNLLTFKLFAGILTGLFVGTKVYTGIVAITGALALLTAQFKRQAVAGTAAGVATAYATGGVSARAAAAGILAFVAATGAAWLAIGKFTDAISTNSQAIQTNSQVIQNHLKDLDTLARMTASTNAKNFKVTTITIKKTKEQILLEKTLAALKKKGIIPTTSLSKEGQDAIQFEAVRLNLIKEGNLEEQRRVAALIANAEAQMRLNEAAQRYADILQVLADAQISPEEVLVLAQKWEMTTGQVLEYIARIYAANTTDLNDGPIVNLLMKWGLTREEAEKYVDFTRALKDEVIDDKEIEELMGKWKMSRAEVLAYALQVRNGTAFSSTWADAGKSAEKSWIDALAALNAYLKAIGTQPKTGPGAPQAPAPVAPQAPAPVAPEPKAPEPKIIPQIPPIQLPGMGGTSRGEYNDAVATVAAILGNDYVSLITAKSGMGGVGRGEYGMTTPSFAGTSTSDYASFRAGERGGITVVVNNAGSVISENDLIETVRNGILAGQGSGLTPLYDPQAI